MLKEISNTDDKHHFMHIMLVIGIACSLFVIITNNKVGRCLTDQIEHNLSVINNLNARLDDCYDDLRDYEFKIIMLENEVLNQAEVNGDQEILNNNFVTNENLQLEIDRIVKLNLEMEE